MRLIVKQRRPITSVVRTTVSYVRFIRELSLNLKILKKVAIYSDLDELKLKWLSIITYKAFKKYCGVEFLYYFPFCTQMAANPAQFAHTSSVAPGK